MSTVPSYRYHFEPGDHSEALACLERHGFCVMRGMIGAQLVAELKESIDRHLDPERSLPLASNRYHMAFAEVSEPVWKLVDHAPYWEFICAVHGTCDLCLHRSAAILRTAGEGMGAWHMDFQGHIAADPKNANQILNRFPIPSGLWFYLNGSDAERSGIAVIENSHLPDWQPAGYEFNSERTGIRRNGADAACQDMDVPGCVAVSAEPGDLICFADRTFHANMATSERRYSCGIGFRPKAWRIDAPWPLPDSARALIDRLPDRLKHYTDGYTGFDGTWRPDRTDRERG